LCCHLGELLLDHEDVAVRGMLVLEAGQVMMTDDDDDDDGRC
jgi:hypothetical protein